MKIQTNLTIPLSWKERLDEMAQAEPKPCTHADLIRRAIRNYYQFDMLSESVEEQCAASFEYFANNFLKILSPTEGLLLLKLYDFQIRWTDFIEENRYTIATKFRQGGFSTVTTLWLFWKALFTENTKIGIISKYDRESTILINFIKQSLDWMPDYFRHKVEKINSHRIAFDNGSSIFSTTYQATCGTILDYIFVDESAFIPNMTNAWRAMFPCIASNDGKCIVVSTPNGVGNWFEETYHKAQKGENCFQIFKADYTEHPNFANEEWATRVRENLGEKGWQQEVLQQFVP